MTVVEAVVSGAGVGGERCARFEVVLGFLGLGFDVGGFACGDAGCGFDVAGAAAAVGGHFLGRSAGTGWGSVCGWVGRLG